MVIHKGVKNLNTLQIKSFDNFHLGVVQPTVGALFDIICPVFHKCPLFVHFKETVLPSSLSVLHSVLCSVLGGGNPRLQPYGGAGAGTGFRR